MIRGCLNGETWQRKPLSLYTELIGIQREPGELKHYKVPGGKEEKTRFPK